MSKYDPLFNYLNNCNKNEIILDFATLENILGFSLPQSAYKYNAWWSNSTKGGQHPFASSWLDAGYKTADVNEMQKVKKMKFVKM